MFIPMGSFKKRGKRRYLGDVRIEGRLRKNSRKKTRPIERKIMPTTGISAEQRKIKLIGRYIMNKVIP